MSLSFSAETRDSLSNLAASLALVLGRLYGGAAIIVGTGEERPEALAADLHPEDIGPGDIKFLHVVSRWQLSTPTVTLDPLSLESSGTCSRARRRRGCRPASPMRS